MRQTRGGSHSVSEGSAYSNVEELRQSIGERRVRSRRAGGSEGMLDHIRDRLAAKIVGTSAGDQHRIEPMRIKAEKKTHPATTGYNFEGYAIRQSLGIVSGKVARGTGFVSEWNAALSDLLARRPAHS